MRLYFHHPVIHSLFLSVLPGGLAGKLFLSCCVAGLIWASELAGAMGGSRERHFSKFTQAAIQITLLF